MLIKGIGRKKDRENNLLMKKNLTAHVILKPLAEIVGLPFQSDQCSSNMIQ